MKQKSDFKFWVLLVNSLIVMSLGANVLFLSYLDKVLASCENCLLLEGCIFILFGLGSLFLMCRQGLLALCSGVLIFFLEVWRIRSISPHIVGHLQASFGYGEELRRAFAPYFWFNLVIVLLAASALIFISIKQWRSWTVWMSAALIGVTLGLLFVTFGVAIAPITDSALWREVFALHWISKLALLLFVLNLLFFISFQVKRYQALWFSFVVGVVCLGGVASSWFVLNVREKNLILKEEMERAEQLVQAIEHQGQLYFSAINRFASRWEEGMSLSLLDADSKSYLGDFQFLDAIFMFEAKNEILYQQQAGLEVVDKAWLEQLLASSTHYALQLNEERLIGFLIFDQNQAYLVNRRHLNGKAIYFVANFSGFLQQVIEFKENKHDGFGAYVGGREIYVTPAADLALKNRYGMALDWDFFGIKLELEYWPQMLSWHALESWAGLYHVVVGVVFSFVFSACLYFMLLSMERRMQAETLNLEKNFFLANISHELRTPLHGIVGALSILETIDIGEEERPWFEGLRKESRALHDLIEELIDLSEMELAGESTTSKSTDLMKLMTTLASKFAKQADHKDISFVFEYQQGLPHFFMADSLRLHQVVRNLVANAIQYTEKGAVALKVQGSLSKDGQYELQLIVNDTGIGIEKADMQFIFEKYKHMEVRDTQGSGLGLAIASRLVKAMGGWIQVESIVGTGSEFTVHLKLPAVENDENQEEND